ncbi:MAG: hypothetical protein HYT81_08685 [Gemmatimonadetes bacterium]|nr:hypothetical protein [Gemmatimonadota bacterium]MBI2403938.1 hypothetical protein [Gemmatimonadota bacterium]
MSPTSPVLVALCALAPSLAAAQARERVGGAEVAPPWGWQRTALGDVVVYTAPEFGTPPAIYVLPGEDPPGDFTAWFDGRWQGLVARNRPFQLWPPTGGRGAGARAG